jgi:hypothetical protein
MISGAISAGEVTLQRLMGFEGEKWLVSNDMGGERHSLLNGILSWHLHHKPWWVANIQVDYKNRVQENHHYNSVLCD